MSSEKIRFYGLLSGLLLIIFLVLFFGEDIQKIVQGEKSEHQLQKNEVAAAIEAEDSLADTVLKSKAHEKNETQTQIVVKKAEVNEPEVIKETFAQEQESLILDQLVVKKEENLSTKSVPMAPKELKQEKNSSLLPASQELSIAQIENAPIQFEEKERKKYSPAQNHTAKEIAPAVSKSTPIKRERSEDAFRRYNQQIKSILRQSRLFHRSLYRLDAEDQQVLMEVVKLLKTFSQPYTLDIEGYVESGASLRSSQAMARKVEGFLQQKLPGIGIRSEGYGDEYPIWDDASAIENRRIEIKLRRK